jgi:hypothetical protein
MAHLLVAGKPFTRAEVVSIAAVADVARVDPGAGRST